MTDKLRKSLALTSFSFDITSIETQQRLLKFLKILELVAEIRRGKMEESGTKMAVDKALDAMPEDFTIKKYLVDNC